MPAGAAPGHGPGAGSGGGSVGGQRDGGPGATGHDGGGNGRDVGRTPGYNDRMGLTRDARGSFRGAGNWGRSVAAPDLSAFGGPGPAVVGSNVHNLGWENAAMGGFSPAQLDAARRGVDQYGLSTEHAVGMTASGMNVDSWMDRNLTGAMSGLFGFEPHPAQTNPSAVAGFLGGMVPGVSGALRTSEAVRRGNPVELAASVVGMPTPFGIEDRFDGMMSNPYGGSAPTSPGIGTEGLGVVGGGLLAGADGGDGYFMARPAEQTAGLQNLSDTSPVLEQPQEPKTEAQQLAEALRMGPGYTVAGRGVVYT